MSDQAPTPPSSGDPLAIICGGGSLPFTVADAAQRQGRRVVLLALLGSADPARVATYPHHWVAVNRFSQFRRLFKSEGCRDVVMIGTVLRPPIREFFLTDLETLRRLPRLIRLFRGGDNRLLSGGAAFIEEYGCRLLGAHEIAPEILVPEGVIAGREPTGRERADIARGMALLRAMSPYDVGQAVIVADNYVVAVEAAEGTDAMLARVAELRRSRRLHVPEGVGVLVKASKLRQDRRIDLPSIGPRTIEGVARAGLAGIAVAAGCAIVAEAERIAAVADRAKVFVVGVPAEEPGQ
jgi:DUF1009 family protein